MLKINIKVIELEENNVIVFIRGFYHYIPVKTKSSLAKKIELKLRKCSELKNINIVKLGSDLCKNCQISTSIKPPSIKAIKNMRHILRIKFF